MGRLSYNRRTSALRLIRVWSLPIIIASLVISGAHFVFADPIPTSQELSDYLQSSELFVASDTVNGFQQVFYTYRDEKFYLTAGNNNHTHPLSSGEFITWRETVDGTSQLVLYNVLTKARLQLSSHSVNQNQVMKGNRVVWEQWQEDRWQIMYYDGFAVRQVSIGDTAVRAAINDNVILYAQQAVTGEWRVLHHNTSTNQTEVIATGGEPNAWPHFNGEEIKTNYPTLD